MLTKTNQKDLANIAGLCEQPEMGEQYIFHSVSSFLKKKVLQSTLRSGRAFHPNRVCVFAPGTSTDFRGSTLGCAHCKVQPPSATGDA